MVSRVMTIMESQEAFIVISWRSFVRFMGKEGTSIFNENQLFKIFGSVLRNRDSWRKFEIM